MDEARKLPAKDKTAFCCPHCDAFSLHEWWGVATPVLGQNAKTPAEEEGVITDELSAGIGEGYNGVIERYGEWNTGLNSGEPFRVGGWVAIPAQPPMLFGCHVSMCAACLRYAIWLGDQIIFPARKLATKPDPSMPENIAKVFEEARSVFESSPRAAAALLRLCVELLCHQLGHKGKNLNRAIKEMVRDGLDVRVQKAFDIVRVTGNDAVHPGTIDEADTRETAEKLFDLVNYVCARMISDQQIRDNLFANLSEGAKKQIEERDTPPEKS